MPKNLLDEQLSNEQPLRSVRQPPPLSEDLIAKLQTAVEKARQTRTAQPSSPDCAEHPSPES